MPKSFEPKQPGDLKPEEPKSSLTPEISSEDNNDGGGSKKESGTETKLEGSVQEQIDKAREILSMNLLGPDEVEKAFGFKVSVEDIPPIPYSLEDLEKAKERGEMLILRVEHDGEGNPMTMEGMDLMEHKMVETDDAKNNPDGGISHSRHVRKLTTNGISNRMRGLEPVRGGWKLVGPEIVEGSGTANYFQQTALLRDYLDSIGALSSEEKEECTDEILGELSMQMGVRMDGVIMSNHRYNNDENLRRVAKKLTELKLNVNHRRNLAEIYYDFLLEYEGFEGLPDLLMDVCDWSNTLSQDGEPVFIGDFPHGYIQDTFLHDIPSFLASSHGKVGVVPTR